jgi:hypothetical protein
MASLSCYRYIETWSLPTHKATCDLVPASPPGPGHVLVTRVVWYRVMRALHHTTPHRTTPHRIAPHRTASQSRLVHIESYYRLKPVSVNGIYIALRTSAASHSDDRSTPKGNDTSIHYVYLAPSSASLVLPDADRMRMQRSAASRSKKTKSPKSSTPLLHACNCCNDPSPKCTQNHNAETSR